MRVNIAYLNGFAVGTVVERATAAVGEVEWTRDPADLIATMPEWGARLIAPVSALIDCALHDFVARRERLSVAAWLGASTQEVTWDTNQTLFWSSFEDFLAQAQAYVDRGFVDLKVRVAAADFAEDLRRIAALRARFGTEIKIAADANGRWSATEALETARGARGLRSCLCRTTHSARRLGSRRPPCRAKSAADHARRECRDDG